MNFLQAFYFSVLLHGGVLQGAKVVEMHPPAAEHQITPGEKVQFELYYGVIPVGKAQMFVYKEFYRVNHRECYRINIQAKTVGAVNWVAAVDDEWGSYVDRVSLLPHASYRDLAEGGFRKKEWTRYDHRTQTVEVKILNNRTNQFYEPKYFHVPWHINDLVSGLMQIRSIPFDTLQVGDTLRTHAFYEETLYDFEVIYEGKELLDTEIGEIWAHRIKPIMPDNPIFDGENSIVAWVSADANQLPLRMKAKMYIGSASLSITGVEGLAFPIGTPKQATDPDSAP